MKDRKQVLRPLAALLLVGLLCCAPTLADTIRLKDGTVIRGQIIGFRDQQFTVLIGSGARGGGGGGGASRRSRSMLYIEDIESIEFEAAAGVGNLSSDDSTAASTGNPTTTSAQPTAQPPTTSPSSSTETRADDDVANTSARPSTSATPPSTGGQPSSSSASSPFFPVNLQVRGDNTSNGWTNSGLVVRRGQRLRISASGRVALGSGRYSTPAGLPTATDRDKLMRNEPTGALVAVIGDDNDDFIFIGRNREFVAQRDGVLFLGLNEGSLTDNSGAYDAVIEAEAVSGAAR